MSLEIELKFITTATAAAQFSQQMKAWKHEYHAPQQLTNIYYETEEKTLRQQDMGLRVRGYDGCYEMTLKTTGQTVGGLHQRPEYNIALPNAQLNIALFPNEVWPEHFDVAALQQQLTPLFSTHFQREKWRVSYHNSEIEVALDCGEVCAGDLVEPLYEIELELLEGQQDALLDFADELIQLEGMRLGYLSKAARGYHLAQGRTKWLSKPLDILSVAAKASVEQGMVAAYAWALAYWQYHEEVWLRGDKHGQQGIVTALTLLRQLFTLFGGVVPRKATTQLRQGLSDLEETLSQPHQQASHFCFSRSSLHTQLALTRWIVQSGWRPFVTAGNQKKLHSSFKRFADITLGRCGAELKALVSHVHQPHEYRDKVTGLCQRLLQVHTLSGAYDTQAVADYLATWQQLVQTIIHDESMALSQARHLALNQDAFWLHSR